MALVPSPPSKHKGWLLLGAAAVAGYACLVVFGQDGLQDLLALRQEQQRFEESVLDQQARNDRLRDRITRLQSDDAYIERVARTKLNLVRRNEIVYRDLRAAEVER